MQKTDDISSSVKILQLPPRRPSSRMHGVDALRAIAAILVVMLHAGIPYMTHPMPGLVWSTTSSEQSSMVDLFCWWIDGFIMPLFFLMTGFFAHQILKQRGPVPFLKHRLTRIGGPLLFGMIVILPLDLYAWLLGWASSGLIPLNKLRSLKIEGELGDALWGVSHLWYLQYALVYCLIAGAVIWLTQKFWGSAPQPRRYPNSLLSHLGWFCCLMLGIGLAVSMLTIQPRIVIGFRHLWLPAWENLLYYAVPFTLGWFWNSTSSEGTGAHWRWLFQIIVAQVLFLGLLPRLRMHVAQETIPVSDPLVPILFTLFGLFMAAGAFGLARTLPVRKTPRAVSYVAAASFWIYLIHHPLVGLIHVDLSQTSMNAETQFLLATAGTLALSLLSYEVLIRRTWVGQLLNGTRDTRAPAQVPVALPIPAASDKRAAA